MITNHEITRLHSDWSIDFGAKVIGRKPRGLIKRLTEIGVHPRHPVFALYRFARHYEATEIGIVFPDIVDSDALPKIDEIPTRYVLNEPWTTSDEDLKTLYLGPLTQGTQVLVNPFPEKGVFVTAWEIVKILAVLGGAITFILLLKENFIQLIQASVQALF